MKTLIKPVAGVFVLTLAACGGGGDGDIGDSFVVSSGLLELELPTEADRGSLPAEVQTLLDTVEAVNEGSAPAATPTTDLSFAGTFGAQFDGGGELALGTVAINYSDTAGAVDATFTPETLDGAAILSGSFGATGMGVTDGFFDGNIGGTIVVDGADTYNVSGTLNGVLVNNLDSIGQVTDGYVENAGDATDNDTFGLIYYAD